MSEAPVEAPPLCVDTPEFERKTIRRVDLRLLPLLGALYAIAVIDRSNLGIARVVGMDKALGLSLGSRYSILTAIYFIPYIIFQLPSNLALRAFGVRYIVSFSVLAWGVVQFAMGFVPTWIHLAVCRALLGVFEAGVFPGLVLVITTWYKRHEVQQRLAVFYVISLVFGGFSAIIGYALSLLNGRGGIDGWAWIFIIEGIFTIAGGILTWFYFPGFPDENNFLTPRQTKLILDRIQEDRGDSEPDRITVRKFVRHLSDWKLWAYAIMYFCATVPAYAFGYFITLILRGMGWSVTASLLLVRILVFVPSSLTFALQSTPPYIVSAIWVVATSWLSDKYQQRAVFIALQTICTIIGLSLTAYVRQLGWRYGGFFFGIAGSAGCIAGLLAYSSNNITSHSKRAVTTAVLVSFGGIGGIFAPSVFRQVDFPRYLPGMFTTIICQVVLLVVLAITTLYFWTQNQKARRGEVILEGQPGFLYTY
ncbi:MFS general substrate transporter [Pluteus cervinus]|uniref:MFS general substrate transporter n=1 Tax=Pluteus cervinus TaxID=181527 RepID=A0ACD3BAI1_9AGAR|nr:MFS general substrate transporter [Pluteus cervinus]